MKILNITSVDVLEVIGSSLNRLLEKTEKTVREIKSGTGSNETKIVFCSMRRTKSICRLLFFRTQPAVERTEINRQFV